MTHATGRQLRRTDGKQTQGARRSSLAHICLWQLPGSRATRGSCEPAHAAMLLSPAGRARCHVMCHADMIHACCSGAGDPFSAHVLTRQALRRHELHVAAPLHTQHQPQRERRPLQYTLETDRCPWKRAWHTHRHSRHTLPLQKTHTRSIRGGLKQSCMRSTLSLRADTPPPVHA